jgi:hypothetical protein
MSGRMKVVFLAGSGAVKNSWGPVLAALARCTRPGAELAKHQAANTLMAAAVHAARFGFIHNKDNREAQNVLVGPRDQIRREIVAELENAGLEVQPEFGDVWRAFVPSGAGVHVATTNWDEAIDRWLKTNAAWTGHVWHIHGVAGGGEIYLPSETSFEPYFSEDIKQSLWRSLNRFQEALKAADRLVIYGLALSPLDAELCLWLSQSLDVTLGHVREVFVVDNDASAVISRLRAISFAETTVDVIKGCKPSNLANLVLG